MESRKLFTTIAVGDLELSNRIVMAPMTRLRAHDDGVPSDIMAQYYAQRATAGLIVTEATMVSPLSNGYMSAPGIYKEAHRDGWIKVVKSVRSSGGRIFLQLWHSGRVSHPFLLDERDPVAPSAIAGVGDLHTPRGKVLLPKPRALGVEEIPEIVNEFRASAKLAVDAGFDGVEIHGAFGYLIDQFLQDVSNKREDSYGGSVENRCRFMVEVAKAVSEVFPKRTGIKLSPSNTFYGMGDSNPKLLFCHALEQLNKLDLAYVHLMEPNPDDIEAGVPIKEVTKTFRPYCKHALITNGGYNRQRADEALANNLAELVSFGRPFIGNPDLVCRLSKDADLVEAKPSTFYGRGPQSVEGYTDYPPFLETANAI